MRCLPLAALFAALSLHLPAPAAPSAPEPLTPAAILADMQRVSAWQVANPQPYSNRYRRYSNDWTYGAWLTGWSAYAGISPDPAVEQELLRFCETIGWKPGPDVYHADDHCVGQTFCELYARHRHDRFIAPIRERFDFILANPPPAPDELDFKRNDRSQKIRATDKWSWCDAIFMGPTAWIRLYEVTGDKRYLDFATQKFWHTYDYLYDKEEHLYFRDSTFFDKREKNGRKVFWSRGNGWVFAGIARILQCLPANHPDRPRFIALFRDMAVALRKAQGTDGMWRPSLLDPASIDVPESSGTGFHAYGFAWGVNQGILDRKTYAPAAEAAWRALTSHILPDGKLGSVQPIGAAPDKVTPEDTENYGVGAFLLLGSEMFRMRLLATRPHAFVRATSTLPQVRLDETLEIPVADLPPAVRKAGISNLVVLDGVSARILDCQPYDRNRDGVPDTLLTQLSFAGPDTRAVTILSRPEGLAWPAPRPRAFARFVPERMDDFAWENDRIGFRTYGPALITGEGTISSGIDVWVKSTRRPVINDWYKSGDYHTDHGDGLDCYKVGPSRGCGGSGIWSDGKLFVSRNFAKWKLLADGPIRAEFELTYEPWDAGGVKVAEVKRITLDAGSNFSRIRSTYTAPAKASLTVAAGIADRGGDGGRVLEDTKAGLLSYWEPPAGPNGHTACALIFPKAAGAERAAADGNFLLTSRIGRAREFTYHAGAGWSRADFPTPESWETHVRATATRLASPVTISEPH